MQGYGTTPNRKLDPIVVFFSDTKEDKRASHEAGRPVFKDVEMVKITFPADRQRTLVRMAHSSAMVFDERGRRSRRVNGKQVSYAELYRDQYRAFKANEAPSVKGTPLSEAPFLTEGKRRTLKALEIYTIEQLSAVNPGSLGMGGVEMVEQAKAYLANAAGSADVTRMASEHAAMKAELEQLRAERLAAAQGQSELTDDQLKERIAELSGAGKPRGNPSRETLLSMLAELENGSAA